MVDTAQPAKTAFRILLVDDEPMVREVVRGYLERDGLSVETATEGQQALELIETAPPDLMVLDVMLPSVDGLEVLQRVRERTSIPVILLTARTGEADRVLGLQLGADDYVVKPFSPRELTARVRAVLRRSLPQVEGERMEFPDLTIDPMIREVLVSGQPVELTPKEFDLLAFLAASPRQVFSRGQLLQHVWASTPRWQDPATVTVHVGRIRQKVETDPAHPRWIVTVWGVGYRFEP